MLFLCLVPVLVGVIESSLRDDLTSADAESVRCALSWLAPSPLASRLLAGSCLLRWRLLRSVFSTELSHAAPSYVCARSRAQGFDLKLYYKADVSLRLRRRRHPSSPSSSLAVAFLFGVVLTHHWLFCQLHTPSWSSFSGGNREQFLLDTTEWSKTSTISYWLTGGLFEG